MGYVLLIGALSLNAMANLLMKAGAERFAGDSGLPGVAAVLGNAPLLAGIALFALNVVFYVAALTRLNLSVAYPVMMAGSLIVIVTASVVWLGETLTVVRGAGVLVLVAGIVLVTWQGQT